MLLCLFSVFRGGWLACDGLCRLDNCRVCSRQLTREAQQLNTACQASRWMHGGQGDWCVGRVVTPRVLELLKMRGG